MLGSGLTVVTEPMAEARSVSIGFWVGAGSRDESDVEAGASHLLEHLLFKGTETRSAAGLAEEMDEVGGDCNAFTAKEYTAFYIRLLAEHLELGLDVLSDILWRPALRADDLDAERHVVLDEILMHADEPADQVAEQSSAALFPGHPLGRDVLGTADSVGAMSADDVRSFFTRHYRPGNIVAAAAGAVDHDAVVAGLAERLGAVSGGAAPAREAPDDRVVPLVVTRRPSEQVHLVLSLRSPDRHDPGRYALALCNHVLGGGLSSRLFQEIRERRGLAYSVWSDRAAYHDAGALSLGLGTSPEHVGEALAVVAEQLDDVIAHGVTERELAIAKGNLRADTLLSGEDSGARMSRIGASTLLHGEVLEVDDLLARIEALTVDDVRAEAARLAGAPRSLAVVGPVDPDRFDAGALGLG